MYGYKFCSDIAKVLADETPGSRRLITYRRKPDAEVDPEAMKEREERKYDGKSADELNPFRKAYFNGFEPVDGTPDVPC